MKYDCIIAGAGCAGLSLMHHFLHSPLRNHSILLIDRDDKVQNDRTWCFWDTQPSPYLSSKHYAWDHIEFITDHFQKTESIDPYRYYCIQAVHFYKEMFDLIGRSSNVTFLRDEVASIQQSENAASILTTSGQVYYGNYVFDSAFRAKPNPDQHLMLSQNFFGWKIKTPTPAFDVRTIRLMDFRSAVQSPPSFFYIVPYAPDYALVEFTRFSPEFKVTGEYRQQLKDYIKNTLGIEQYEIVEQEKGLIPMTNYPFQPREGKRIIRIGTAGGDTKSSTGYTFQNIQHRCRELIGELTGEIVPSPSRSKRFGFYDQLLLSIMKNQPEQISRIMGSLFQKNKFTKILEFLDEDTPLGRELLMLVQLPWGPFAKAFVDSYLSSKSKQVTSRELTRMDQYHNSSTTPA
jgi:lycopene beta-cyclase